MTERRTRSRTTALDDEVQRSFLIARLAPRRGERLLDLGCGAGEDVAEILRLHRGVRAVGFDRWDRMLQGARFRLSRDIKRGTAALVLGDAGAALPFASASFDAVYSAELMECLLPEGQTRLLREIHRLLKPRGRVLIEHTDWDTQVWNAGDRALERKLVHAFCDWTQGWMERSDGWMGRKLPGLFRQSKLFRRLEVDAYVLTNDRYEPGRYGHARAQDLLAVARAKKGVPLADVKRFLRDLAAKHRAGEYFYSVNRYMVIARKGS